VEAAVRLFPKLFTVMETPVVVAVNLYHTPFVVVAVAPPQDPVGAAFAAPCRFPVTVAHVEEGVNTLAVKQLVCENTSDGKLVIKKTAIEFLTIKVLIRTDFADRE
jgi:hypothetical protein